MEDEGDRPKWTFEKTISKITTQDYNKERYQITTTTVPQKHKHKPQTQAQTNIKSRDESYLSRPFSQKLQGRPSMPQTTPLHRLFITDSGI